MAIKNIMDERRLAKRRGMVFVITTPHDFWTETLKGCMGRNGLDARLYGEQLPLDLDLVVVSLSAPYEFNTDRRECFSRGRVTTPEGKAHDFTVSAPLLKTPWVWQPLLATAVVSEVKRHFRL